MTAETKNVRNQKNSLIRCFAFEELMSNYYEDINNENNNITARFI